MQKTMESEMETGVYLSDYQYYFWVDIRAPLVLVV